VIAAVRGRRREFSVTERRPQAHADARRSGEWAQSAHQHLRAEHAAVALEARAEVGHLDGGTVRTEEPGTKHRRVADVFLLAALEAAELDRPVAARAGLVAAVDERVKDGIAVEPWQAAPDDARLAIDERGDHAVAGDAEVEGGLRGHDAAPPASDSRLFASQAWTSPTPAMR
jgi:hypothetical protein